jgi:hypothetical protein
MTAGKKGAEVGVPFPPYSLSTSLPLMCTTPRRMALASRHRPLPWLLRLARGWSWRSSTSDGWRREELNRRRGRRSRQRKLRPWIWGRGPTSHRYRPRTAARPPPTRTPRRSRHPSLASSGAALPVGSRQDAVRGHCHGRRDTARWWVWQGGGEASELNGAMLRVRTRGTRGCIRPGGGASKLDRVTGLRALWAGQELDEAGLDGGVDSHLLPNSGDRDFFRLKSQKASGDWVFLLASGGP